MAKGARAAVKSPQSEYDPVQSGANFQEEAWFPGKAPGVVRMVSEARAITDQIGNCTAAVLVTIWEKEIDWSKFKQELAKGSEAAL